MREMAKNTKPADVRAKTADELSALLLDLRKEQFNLRFQRATGQQEGVGRVRQVRRDIARVKTIMAEKKASAAHAGTKSRVAQS
jgi:large subunit ribosomal protein L29